jgi:hypothetical protein
MSKRGLTKEERAAKWDSEFIPCKKHPERRCNKYSYVKCGAIRCGTCKNCGVKALSRLQTYRATEKGKATVFRWNHSAGGHSARAWHIERKLHG